MKLIPLILLSATLVHAQWPVPKTALGIDLLTKLLPYLDQPLVRDLSAGNRDLAARSANLYSDFAQAYLIQDKPPESLNWFPAQKSPEPLAARAARFRHYSHLQRWNEKAGPPVGMRYAANVNTHSRCKGRNQP